ncbi:hypothetical protein GGR54DRAFT_598344 [Hypoxylon sp. NC1633]|nr:hypothetical protein GGR54DRAFT_598344 [Hypoxylon sp. NC1633]
MPPILPRSALLPRAATTSTPITRALFSSSATRSFRPKRIPPESPLFINVPNPPQDQSIEALRELKPVKGHMPIPRQVFKKKDGHLKPREAWLSKSAPAPTSARQARPARSQFQAWKRQVAANRRQNMREGVVGLYARKKAFDAIRSKTQTAAQAVNRAAAAAPEREVDRLTRGSVNANTLQTAVLPDPQRFERAQASLARTQILHATRSEVRRDAIQELYMRARSFIVDEKELEAEVDKLFAEDYWSKTKTATGFVVQNVWDMNGRPMSVADRLRDVSRTSSDMTKAQQTEQTRTLKRQQQVAEELTGGKLEEV